MTSSLVVTLASKQRVWHADATRVCFSAHRCFSILDGESRTLLGRLAEHLSSQPDLVLWDGPLLVPLLEAAPYLRRHIVGVITENKTPGDGHIDDILTCTAESLPGETKTIFLCQTRAVERMVSRAALPAGLNIIDADILAQIAFEGIPARGWTPVEKNIYPINVPQIAFEAGLDMILIDCPARNLALMPNGLGYVHNTLKKTGIKFQTFDLDIVTYHRYHIRRLFDEGGKIVLPSGRELPTDPWQAEHYDVWSSPEVVTYLSPIIDEAADAIIEAKPKILGLSIQQCSEAFSRYLVNRVKAALPDLVIIVGGFSCYNADIGLRAFPEAEYMCIGESDLTVGPLVKRLARGEKPRDQPGVLSRHDTPGRMFVPAPMPHNLDQIDFPRYEWCDLSIYRNYNGYQLVPIIASRGCRWSRCTFCAERFYWRIRSDKNFADELEWLVEQGCTLFMFNESDLNGMPEKLLEICDEIIRRDLKVRLTGQLRIHKSNDRAFFDKLRQAGFVALRFGVDAFSENTVRLQKKGYTTKMISQNLKDCWEAGIYTEVNWVIGVPGETDADCDEGIDLILANRPYIGRLANINPLILVNGSVYWIDPESHGVRFREPQEQLYAKFPRALPADTWYSVDPFIDAQVRKKWFERIVIRLHDAGFPVGPWAERVIEDVKLARDVNRAGRAQKTVTDDAGDSPVPVRSVDTHAIVRFKGRFYAVPHALGDIDLGAPGAADVPGIIAADREDALLVEIEHAKQWANSRGQYDAQERQRVAGSLYRVDSVSTVETQNQVALAERPFVVQFKGEYFTIERDKLEPTTTVPNQVQAPSGNALGPRTMLHRLADTMPLRVSAELRSIWRSRKHTVPHADGRPAPLDVITTVAGGLFDRYVLGRRPTLAAGVPVPGSNCEVIKARSKDVQPSLLTTVGNYNVVEFDGMFYGLPHGLAFDWEDSNAEALPGVIVCASAREVLANVRAMIQTADRQRDESESLVRGSGPAGETSNVPRLIASLEGYNIVSYEGWIYGLPWSLGEIDLAEVDVIGLEGVIRDVSRDVVENEINDLIAARRQAAE